jgi:predicted porin
MILVIGSSLSAFEFYNQNGTTMGMDGRIKLKIGSEGFNDIVISNQASRVAFEGSKVITDGVKASARFEWGFDPVSGVTATDLDLYNRIGYVRFDVKGHQITVGQQNAAWKKVVDWTDMYEVYGASSHNSSEIYGTGRAPAVQYNTKFGNIDFTANAQVKNAWSQWSAGAALVAKLMEDSLSVGATAQYVSDLDVGPGTDDPFLMAAGLNWMSDFGLTAALTASYHIKTMNGDGFGFESYLSYLLGDSGHDIYIGNNYMSLDTKDVNYIDIGGRLRLLPGSSLFVFVEGKIDLDDFDNASALWLGTRYSF